MHVPPREEPSVSFPTGNKASEIPGTFVTVSTCTKRLALRARSHTSSPRRDSDRIMEPALKARFNAPVHRHSTDIGARMNRAFSAGGLALHESSPRRAADNAAPLALTVRYRGDLLVTDLTNASVSRYAIYPLPLGQTWIDAARRCVARLLRLEIGVYEDEVVRWRRPEQLRALCCLAHPGHPQFEQRSRP